MIGPQTAERAAVAAIKFALERTNLVQDVTIWSTSDQAVAWVTKDFKLWRELNDESPHGTQHPCYDELEKIEERIRKRNILSAKTQIRRNRIYGPEMDEVEKLANDGAM